MAYRMKDVAERAGVSTATVSHVINGTRYVSEELAMRVRQAMKELGYTPNPAARSLRTQSTRTVGLIVPMLESDTSNLFFMKIAHGVHAVLKQHGYSLVLANSLEDEEAEAEQLKIFASQMVDGIIIAPVSDHAWNPKELVEHRPIVFVDRRPAKGKLDCITADGRGGVREAVTRFIHAGHQKIGFISGLLNVSTSIERREGYESALTEHGIPVDPTLIYVGPSTFESGYALAHALLTEHPDVTAIMVANNVLTMGVVAYLQEHRIEVPSQVALIGFDDYDWSRVTTPPLTVIRQPAYEMGKKAAEILLRKLANPRARCREWRLPTELVIRGSG